MKVTSVSVTLSNKGKVRGYASIVLDDCLVIHGLKIVEEDWVLTVLMPTKKQQDGTYGDLVNPINPQTREMIEHAVLKEYRRVEKNPRFSMPRSF